MQNRFDNFVAIVKYIGCLGRNSHSFGQLNWIPKASGFEKNVDDQDVSSSVFKNLKFRPLGSYQAHRFASTYRLCSRVFEYVLSTVDAADPVSVITAYVAMKKTASCRQLLFEKEMQGDGTHFVKMKLDVNKCFGNVDRQTVVESWSWFCQEWRREHGRRREYVVIPKTNQFWHSEYPCRVSAYSVEFNHRLRHIAKTSWHFVHERNQV